MYCLKTSFHSEIIHPPSAFSMALDSIRDVGAGGEEKQADSKNHKLVLCPDRIVNK